MVCCGCESKKKKKSGKEVFPQQKLLFNNIYFHSICILFHLFLKAPLGITFRELVQSA